MLLYIVSFAIGMGPVFWVLLGEIFPPRERAEGVGAKLAARIVNELHGKVTLTTTPTAIPSALAAAPSEAGAAADAVSALVNLGYRRAEAFGAVAAVAQRLGGDAEAGALIRAGLQELAR